MTPTPDQTANPTPSTAPTNYVNPNMAWQNNVGPTTPTPQTTQPTPQPQSPAPTTQTQNSQGAPGGETTSSTNATPPQTNLQPGATGADVQKLQDYLVQHGYLQADQVGQGYGTYGPKTTAAVALMQQKLGLNPASGSGSYGPQTQAALANKYQGIFNSVQNSTAPDTQSQASQTLAGMANETSTTDPVMGAYMAQMGPIMQSLQQVMSNINNPALTAVSLQTEYDDMRQKYNLPEMQASLLNMQNIMNGTIQDVRDEVTKAGGFATESQVQGIAATRNTVLLKQYNALNSQYTAATTNVDNMMKYATQDQQTQLQRAQASAQVTESMASIQNQMLTMGLTMQKNAREAAQYNVTQMGYTGLAASTSGNPQLQGYYENILGLQPGSLSDPTKLAAMDTYKQQQLQINNYRAAIAAYNAGYGGSPFGGNTGVNGNPMSLSNPGGNPQGPGTQALADGLLLSPASNVTGQSIMQATGLNATQYSALTNSNLWKTLPRGQKLAITNQVNDWLTQHGNVDMATFQSQYKTLNENVNDYTTRLNTMQLAEKNVMAAVPTISPAAANAGLGDVNIANVVSLWKGQQVNDPKATEYMLYFKDLQNSIAYFYAAQRGNKSADDGDVAAAAKVITSGLAQGGIKGVTDGFNNISARENMATASTIDDVTKQIWGLFGSGDQYKPPSHQMVTMNYGGKPYSVPASQFDQALQKGYSLGGYSLPSIPIK